MADIKIYGELVNDTPGGKVARAAQIKVDENKSQDDFNNEVVDAISQEQRSRSAADTALYNTLEEFKRLSGLSVIESSEFINAITDSQGKFLFGIRTDGSVEWGKGVPEPIRVALERLSSDVTESLDTLRNDLSQSIQEVEDKTVLSLDINQENGDVILTYGSESTLTDAEIDPLTGDINFYYDL